jgi:hypothetical protein
MAVFVVEVDCLLSKLVAFGRIIWRARNSNPLYMIRDKDLCNVIAGSVLTNFRVVTRLRRQFHDLSLEIRSQGQT